MARAPARIGGHAIRRDTDADGRSGGRTLLPAASPPDNVRNGGLEPDRARRLGPLSADDDGGPEIGESATVGTLGMAGGDSVERPASLRRRAPAGSRRP